MTASHGLTGATAIGRRDFLRGGALAAGGVLLTSRLAFAAAEGDARFVLLILRGALDGLAAVPPVGDPDYARLRGELAIAAGGALPLDGTFGLHPALAFLHERYRERELLVLHAVATPYRERSHFDGQDVLENGLVRPHAVQTGWLNRALAAVPRRAGASPRELGVALGQNVPLVMRGPAQVASWAPSRLAALDDDTLQRIADLYAADPMLSRRLADALATDAIAASGAADAGATGDAGAMAPPAGTRPPQRAPAGARYQEVLRATANFLVREDGPRVAVLDATGWDTHANEGGAQGQLALRLGALDAGLRTLRDRLGATWSRTIVAVVTEFGRTAATNGTRGTDHGTGAAAFLVGGAVRGGRVLADWPGLAPAALYESRDLRPTLDLRAAFKGVLVEHLGVPVPAVEERVFADSGTTKSLRDVVRA